MINQNGLPQVEGENSYCHEILGIRVDVQFVDSEETFEQRIQQFEALLGFPKDNEGGA